MVITRLEDGISVTPDIVAASCGTVSGVLRVDDVRGYLCTGIAGI